MIEEEISELPYAHNNVKFRSEIKEPLIRVSQAGQIHSWCSVGIPPRHHGGSMRNHLHERHTEGVSQVASRHYFYAVVTSA